VITSRGGVGEAAAGSSENSAGEHEPMRGPRPIFGWVRGSEHAKTLKPSLSGRRARRERSTNEGASVIRVIL
jgi:hypothetical protein